jgi:hypothetical protein
MPKWSAAPSVAASTSAIASCNAWPLGNRPSVSTVNAINYRDPGCFGRTDDADGLSSVGRGQHGDAIGTGGDEGVDLGAVVGLGRLGREHLTRLLAVAAGTDVAADDHVDTVDLVGELSHEGHRVAIDAVECYGVVAEPSTPVRVGAPRRCFQPMTASASRARRRWSRKYSDEERASLGVVQPRDCSDVR